MEIIRAGQCSVISGGTRKVTVILLGAIGIILGAMYIYAGHTGLIPEEDGFIPNFQVERIRGQQIADIEEAHPNDDHGRMKSYQQQRPMYKHKYPSYVTNKTPYDEERRRPQPANRVNEINDYKSNLYKHITKESEINYPNTYQKEYSGDRISETELESRNPLHSGRDEISSKNDYMPNKNYQRFRGTLGESQEDLNRDLSNDKSQPIEKSRLPDATNVDNIPLENYRTKYRNTFGESRRNFNEDLSNGRSRQSINKSWLPDATDDDVVDNNIPDKNYQTKFRDNFEENQRRLNNDLSHGYKKRQFIDEPRLSDTSSHADDVNDNFFSDNKMDFFKNVFGVDDDVSSSDVEDTYEDEIKDGDGDGNGDDVGDGDGDGYGDDDENDDEHQPGNVTASSVESGEHWSDENFQTVIKDTHPRSKGVCSTSARIENFKMLCPSEDMESHSASLDKDTIYKNILVDDKHGILYCAIPKAGAKSFKTLLALARETVNPDLDLKSIHEILVLRFHGLWSLNHYSRREKIDRLKNYHKFIVVRHPWARIQSVFEDKLLDKRDKGNYKDRFMKFHNATGADEISWERFLEFITQEQDNHWESYVNLCHPCHIGYNQVIKLETLNDDMGLLFDRIKGSGYELPGINIRPQKPETLEHASKLFSDISPKLEGKLLQIYQKDLDLFGYGWSQDSGATCQYSSLSDDCC